jgi:hypothetical protein
LTIGALSGRDEFVKVVGHLGQDGIRGGSWRRMVEETGELIEDNADVEAGTRQSNNI